MSPVSRGVYDKVRAALASTLEKNKDNLLSKVVPFNCVIAREIGLQMDPKVVSAFNAMPAKDRYSAQATFPLIDVINAMEEYGYEKYGLEGFDVVDDNEPEEAGPILEMPSFEEAPSPSPVEESDDE